MSEPDQPPEGPQRTNLMDDLNEVMPDAMVDLSSRVRVYVWWMVITAVISAAVVLCSKDETPEAQESGAP